MEPLLEHQKQTKMANPLCRAMLDDVYAFPLVKLPHSECITETIEYTRDDHKRERDDDETNERVLFFFSLRSSSKHTFALLCTSSSTES